MASLWPSRVHGARCATFFENRRCAREQEAEALAESGDMAGALGKFDSALLLAPDNASLHDSRLVMPPPPARPVAGPLSLELF